MSELELALMVKERLLGGSPFLHISGLQLENLGPGEQTDKIREISQEVGSLTLSNAAADSDVWLLDSRTSPNTQLV